MSLLEFVGYDVLLEELVGGLNLSEEDIQECKECVVDCYMDENFYLFVEGLSEDEFRRGTDKSKYLVWEYVLKEKGFIN